MDADAAQTLLLDRIHFGGTVIFHYLFPQLTMGLALLLAVLATIGYWLKNDRCNRATGFWTNIFAVTFAFGVATGVPMEFQFGTNWSRFAEFAGGCLGQTLALEGTFAFFLEASFLGVMLAGTRRVGPFLYWLATVIVFLGAWLSAYFILASNAWMQHPVGYSMAEDGTVLLENFFDLLTNPWLVWQYTHNQSASLATGSFVMASVGAFYLLSRKHEDQAKLYLKVGVIAGAVASVLLLYPTGHGEAHQVMEQQPIKGAAMEGLFYNAQPAPVTIMGQPNMETLEMDNPIEIPGMLSFLTYRNFDVEVRGLKAFPRDQWPDSVPLVYYAYHIMVGLGTIFIAVMLVALVMLWSGKLYNARWMLWIIMLALPFPYIATIAGWVTTEAGRQPWLAYGLLQTADGYSEFVSSGNVMFTLLGFLGLYLLMLAAYAMLEFGLVGRGPMPTEVEGIEASHAGHAPREDR